MSEPFPVLILASRSPQRRELLAEAGHRFEVCPASDFAESGIFAGESPADFVARLAYQKAADVAARLRAGWILGCDTVAECDGQVLGKPIDVEHARSMLRAFRPAAPSADGLVPVEIAPENTTDRRGHDHLADGSTLAQSDRGLSIRRPMGRQSRGFRISRRPRLDSYRRGKPFECRRPAAGTSRDDAVQFRLSV